MTTLLIKLSQQDEKFLQDMIANRTDVNTLEEAVLKCVHENSLIKMMSGNQPPTHLRLKQTQGRNFVPIVNPDPAPQLFRDGDRFLLITGDPGNIDDIITMISKGISFS